MEFINLNGLAENDNNFISINIKDGNRYDSVDNQIWISKDGTEMQVCINSDIDVLEEIMKKFKGNSSRAFRNALHEFGIKI
jgi:hypothetical protein